jgi:hypothetical protein
MKESKTKIPECVSSVRNAVTGERKTIGNKGNAQKTCYNSTMNRQNTQNVNTNDRQQGVSFN